MSTHPALTMTVAICTRNRADYVGAAVRSLLAQDVASDRLDILVVDNGSTDHTARTVEELAATDPRVTYALEARPGLSRARNRAIELASGDVVAFLDDDAVAVPGWARIHLDAFADETVVATGGRISLVWPGHRPDWLPVDYEGMYAGLDLGDAVRDFSPSEIPYGANMAFRRSIFDHVDPFLVELGRQGRGLLSGEERELCERLHRAGGRLVYLPAAAVDHHVLPDRVGRSWLIRRCYDQGRSHVVMDLYRSGQRSRPYWAKRAAYRAGRAGLFALSAASRVASRAPVDSRTEAAADAAQSAGTAVESLRALRWSAS